jgi:hypothetical protein
MQPLIPGIIEAALARSMMRPDTASARRPGRRTARHCHPLPLRWLTAGPAP